jgi:hypothetical protein
MIEQKPCPGCGVPDYISSEHIWLNNGDIVQGREFLHRILFIEIENLDPIIGTIEEILGKSIENNIVRSMTRTVQLYLSTFIPKEIRELVRCKRIDPAPIGETTAEIARILGMGDYRVVDSRFEMDEADFVTVRISKPYCLPLAAAALAGSVEAVHGCEQQVAWKKISSDTFEVTASPAVGEKEIPLELDPWGYAHSEGDIDLERCTVCEAPLALSQYDWLPDEGLIIHKASGKRMAIFGHQEIEPAFHELEKELGKNIPNIVIEAQRRFTRTGFYSSLELWTSETSRKELALRGLGNLKESKLKKGALQMRIENAALYLILIGLAQGLFELHFDVESNVDWEMNLEDGILQLEVTPKRQA